MAPAAQAGASASRATGTFLAAPLVNWSIQSSPYTWRAASWLWAAQSNLHPSTVEAPPLPRGTM